MMSYEANLVRLYKQSLGQSIGLVRLNLSTEYTSHSAICFSYNELITLLPVMIFHNKQALKLYYG